MTWSAITYKAYNSDIENIFAVDGTNRKRIATGSVEEWGLDAPIQAPFLSTNDAGTALTGDYNACYTWGRREKGILVCESNAGPYQLDSEGDPDPQTLAAGSLRVLPYIFRDADVQDDQINAIRFYRTKADGSTYYFDTELSYGIGAYACIYDWEETEGYITGQANRPFYEDESNGRYYIYAWEVLIGISALKDIVTYHRIVPGDNVYEVHPLAGDWIWDTYIDCYLTKGDDSLGSEPPTTHNRPPLGTYVAGPSFNGIVFIIKEGQLYYSLSQQPEYWPLTYYLDVSSPDNPGKCLVFYNKHPYFITLNKIFYISGSGAADFYPIDISAKTGTQSVRGCLAIDGIGIFHIGSDGIYLTKPGTEYFLGKDDKFTQAFNRTFRGETVNGIPGIYSLTNAWLAFWHDKLYFGYVASGNTYPADILVFDFGTNRTSYMNVIDSVAADVEFICATVDEKNDRLLFCDSDGYVWHMEDADETEDDSVAINWDVESKDFTLQTRRHFPRWVKYDVAANHEDCSATGTVYLDSASQQTHSLTSNRDTKRRLVATGNGRRMSIRINGSGPVSIYAVEAE